MTNDIRTVNAWLLYDWETQSKRWLDWHDDVRPANNEKLYYVSVHLDPKAQFLQKPEAHEAVVERVAYKDPCVPAPKTPEDFWKHLTGYVAGLVTHIIPPSMYGPDVGPMTTRFEKDCVKLDLPDGTHVDISVKVTRPTGKQPRLECDSCGSRPYRFELLTDEHKAGDQCPCCYLDDYDCDGVLVEIPPEEKDPA